MIAVFHPGVQHSHQLAWALSEVDLLGIYISGVPIANGETKTISQRFALHNRSARIPSSKKFHFIVFSVIRKISGTLFGFGVEQRITLVFDMLFDLLMSVYVRIKKPVVVVGYENACYFTFKQVKKYSGRCILDAAGIHFHALVDRNKFLIGRIVEFRKSNEQKMADLILCCSDYAKQSYARAGISSNKLQSVPLGVEISKNQRLSITSQRPGELSIVFAGSISYAKGVDLVVDAISSCIRDHGCKISLTLVGRVADNEFISIIDRHDWIEHIDYLDQHKLFEIMRKKDVSILFSRNDSFGMVVPEAMSCGCPVIVSDHVGAKEIIAHYPDAGWIVELNSGELAACIKAICRGKDGVGLNSRAALEAADAYSWTQYRRNVQSLMASKISIWGCA